MINRKALRAAAAAVGNGVLASLPEPEECSHDFPLGFTDSFKPALGIFEKRQKLNTAIHAAIAAVLALVLALGAFVASSPEARAAISRWFREVISGGYVYRSTETAEGGLPHYIITDLPEGMTETDSFSNEIMSFTSYDSGGEALGFSCNLLSTGAAMGVYDGGGGLDCEAVNINGIAGEFYPGTAESPTSVLVWVDEEAGVMFSIDSTLPKSVILHIAESVILAD